MPRKFDVTLYGATGFTGKLAAQYLAASTPPSIKWAIAGRTESKLQELKRSLTGQNADCGVVVAGDAASLSAMCDGTKVVISTAGPYALVGEPVVQACVRNGTDYCDITGETSWVAQMIQKYGDAAKATGAILVSMSGFDSVPSDLGTFFVSKYVRERHGLPVSEVVNAFVMSMSISGGTVATALNELGTPGVAAMAGDPLLLFPGHVAGSPPSAAEAAIVEPLPDHAAPFWLPEISKYATHFPMASINTRVVRRSAGIFAQEGAKLKGNALSLPALAASSSESSVDDAATITTSSRCTSYSAPGTPFRYSEHIATSMWLVSQSLALGARAAPVLASLPGALSVARWFLPAPGEGPSDERRAKSFFTMYCIAHVGDGGSSGGGSSDGGSGQSRVIGTVKGHDGGYTDTSRMLVEAGLLLAGKGRAKLPGASLGGGFLTPATAFGSALVDALDGKEILRFAIERDDVEGASSSASTFKGSKAGESSESGGRRGRRGSTSGKGVSASPKL